MKYTWKQWRWIGLWVANLLLILAVWASLSLSNFGLGSSSSLMAVSRLAGLLAAFTVLTQLWLIGRGRFLERDFGLERLSRVHRWNGFLAVIFVVLHVLTLITAKSAILGIAPPEVLPHILANYPDTLKALIAELALFAIVISSLVIVRRRLKYEYWYYVHLLTYVVVIFAFSHQLTNGQHLLSIEWFRLYWIALYFLSIGTFVAYRIVRPFWLWNKHRFRIARVVEEANGVHSLYISGRDLQNFHYEAGQFAKFWFVAKGYWLEEHPFSISIEPRNDDTHELRITPKAVGDFTTKLPAILEGTPVVIDGPYGRFTTAVATHKKLVFVAGGIGITPIRAMLGELASASDKRDLTLFYSAKSAGELVFKYELESLAKRLKLKMHYIVTDGSMPEAQSEMLTGIDIKHTLGKLAKTDFYVCGPPAMMQAIKQGLVAEGVLKTDIHYEQFSLIKQ